MQKGLLVHVWLSRGVSSYKKWLHFHTMVLLVLLVHNMVLAQAKNGH